MKHTHTPGPWRVANGRIYSRAYQTALDLRLFVICDLDMGNDPRGEQESNARLIAAAPEMLYALKMAADELNKMGCECDCEPLPVHCPVCAVRTAINKATQES